MKTTWESHERHGRLTRQSDLPDSVYAFPWQRKEPLTDASHVRNAVARFIDDGRSSRIGGREAQLPDALRWCNQRSPEGEGVLLRIVSTSWTHALREVGVERKRHHPSAPTQDALHPGK